MTETTKTVTRHPSATLPATAQFQSPASNTAPNAALQANPSVIHQATATPPASPKKGSGSVRTRPATEGGIWAYIPPHPDEIEPLEPINQRIYVISRGEEVGIFNTWCIMFSFLLPLAHPYLKAWRRHQNWLWPANFSKCRDLEHRVGTLFQSLRAQWIVHRAQAQWRIWQPCQDRWTALQRWRHWRWGGACVPSGQPDLGLVDPL